MTTSLLTSLEQQLAALQANIVPNIPKNPIDITPTKPENVTVNMTDLRSMVKEIIDAERVGIGRSSSIESLPEEKQYTLQEAINLALTGEEQNWLLQDDIIRGVANFMATDEGKAITRIFIDEYRSTYENKI